jgi:hypothetical protein
MSCNQYLAYNNLDHIQSSMTLVTTSEICMSSGGIVDGTLLDLRGAVWPPGAECSYQDLQNSVYRKEDHKVQGKTGSNVQRGPVEYGELSSEGCVVPIDHDNDC